MVIVVAIVGVVVVVLLWRILRVQHARAEIEATRARVEIATRVAHDAAQWMAYHEGGWEKARSEKRLIEWTDSVVRTLQLDEDDFALRLEAKSGAELRNALIEESFARGVPCRWLNRDDFDRFKVDYPGPEPKVSWWCGERCDEEHDVRFPDGFQECPFCGAELEPLETPDEFKAEHVAWEREIDKLARYRRLFPDAFVDREQQDTKVRAEASERERVKFDRVVAEFRAQQTG